MKRDNHPIPLSLQQQGSAMSMECDPRREMIEGVLRNVLASEDFQRSKRLSRFLSYIVHECLEGRQDRIKAYAIGLSVFDRPAHFDPNSDPLVRIEAGRLRRALERYNYSSHDPIQIDIPKGAYVPVFKTCVAIVQSPDSGDAVQPRLSFIEGARSAISSTKWGVRVTFAASLVAAAAALISSGYWMRAATSEKPLFAVLPFTAIGANRAQQIASGVSEEVISVLAEQGEIATLSRFATEMHGTNTATQGHYNIRYFVEGSVFTSETKGVVAAQLVDARGGQVLWSAQYNIPSDGDLVTLQSDLGRGIAQQIVGPNGVIERLPQPKGAVPRTLVQSEP